MKDVTGLILAGGSSRRFGSDKALHVLNGKPLIAHVYDAVSSIVDTVFVSVGASSRTYPIAAHPLLDTWVDAGPLAGIHAGLRAAATPWLLVVACDMPFVDAGTLHQLLDARGDGVEAVVAHTPDGWHPTCACYHQRLVPKIEAHHQGNRLALRALVAAIRTEPVDVDTAYLKNINMRSDLDW